MIFVSAGTQFPFDRLIKMVDRLVDETGEEVVAQAIPDKYMPRNFSLRSVIPQKEYSELVDRCDLVVAHAGMGIIITAMRLGKPILVLPRLASRGEHRNEHQTSTVAHLEEMGYVTAISDIADLRRYAADRERIASHTLNAEAQPKLIDFILKQINEAAALQRKK